MPVKSISFRLIFGAALWITIALMIMGQVLTGMFRDHLERAFDTALHGHIEELLALSEVNKKGLVVLKRHPVDPQFNKPLSGWYWEILFSGNRFDRSRSLWDQKIRLPEGMTPEQETSFMAKGPRGEQLRGRARTFTMPGASEPFSILVAGPVKEIETAVSVFTNTMAASLGVLGIGLVVAAFLQVRFGLRPLKRMRNVLLDIRAGRASRMEGDFASELAPLAKELNALLDHNAAIIARARTQAGNLAHAMKTPLAVLTNEADRLDKDTGDIFRDQTALMAEQIARHLSRARVAATRGLLGAHSDVHETADRLRRTLKRLHEERAIDISLKDTQPLMFQGEQQDLEEMLGNLMDNAAKWASKLVVVSAEYDKQTGTLYINVDDDGPGVPEESLSVVLNRGKRLDETKPGSGLGLDIVCDIAEMYDGSLELTRSALGGLRARLKLPAA